MFEQQMRIFDSLCRIMRQHSMVIPKRLQRIVRESRLFVFPGRAHEEIPYDVLYAGDREWLSSNFFLPMPIVAVADTASVVVLWDEPDRYIELDQPQASRRKSAATSEVGLFDEPTSTLQIGSGHRRGFLECLPTDGHNVDEFGRHPVSVHGHLLAAGERVSQSALSSSGVRGSHCVTWGYIDRFTLLEDLSKRFEIYGAVQASIDATPERIIGVGGRDYPLEHVAEVSLRNVATAYEEVAFHNTPNRWVVETRKERATKAAEKSARKNESYIPLADERPLYRMLTRESASDLFPASDQSQGGLHKGHERSAHPRTYRHPRFTNKRGLTVIMPAIWVGPTEARDGNTLHRILVRR